MNDVKKDMVNSPAHYNRYGLETIDALRGTMSSDEFNGFLKGNLVKYVTRAGAKDAVEQEYHKAIWYAAWLYLANGGTVDKLLATVRSVSDKLTSQRTEKGVAHTRTGEPIVYTFGKKEEN